MDKKKNCSAYNTILNRDNHKKDKTVCKTGNNKNKRKNNINNTITHNQQPKNDNVNTIRNNRTLLLGPTFSGKTHLML